MIAHLKKLHHIILNIIAPPFCLSCKIFLDADTVLCVPCKNLIKPVVSQAIAITKTISMPVLGYGAYEPPLRSLILSKSRSNRAVSYQLGKLLWDCSYIRHTDFDIIVPVPLHWTRYAWRGYNQAEEMAKYIAEQTGKPIIHLLRRVTRTPFQSDVRGDKRRENVKDVFELTADYTHYLNKKILLIDDLMTTGATLQSVAKRLIKLKPEKLTAFVAARVIQ